MFRENKKHREPNLFVPSRSMNERESTMLKKSWAGFFYEYIFTKIDETLYKDLFCTDNGRPNFPINILVSLELIKEIEGIPDEQLINNYHFNRMYHHAMGIEDIEGFELSPRTLYNFRYKKEEYESRTNSIYYEDIFNKLKDRIIEELSIKMGKQRIDSTMIQSNIKQMSRLTLLHKTLSNLVTVILKNKETVSKELLDLVGTKEDNFSYRLNNSERKLAMVQIAEFLFYHVDRWKSHNKISKTTEYKTAERVLEEQCIIKPNFKVEIKEIKDIPQGSVQNPADPDATYRNKNNKSSTGYSVTAVETCDPDNPMQVITKIELNKNTIDDAKILSENIDELKKETNREVIIGDGAYASNESRRKCKDNKVDLFVTEIRGKKQDENILDSLDFKYQENGLIDACPNGYRPTNQKIDKEGNLVANFDFQICNQCPMKYRCIAGKNSDKQSRLVVDDRRRYIDERKRKMGTEEFVKTSNLRPNIEGTMEKLKPKWLNGRSRFRGMRRNQDRMLLKGTIINYKRRIRLLLLLFIRLIENKLHLLDIHFLKIA